MNNRGRPGEASQQRGQGPYQRAGTVQAARVETIRQPAPDRLAPGVRPEASRQQRAKLNRCEPQLGLYGRSGRPELSFAKMP